MTRTLQILFISILGLILLFWLGDLLMGLPADVSDRAVTEGWAEDREMYGAELTRSRLWTLAYAIPAIILLVLTFKSIREPNDRMFYWTLLLGLTIFQIVPIAGLVKSSGEANAFLIAFIVLVIIICASGQVLSVYRIIKWRTKCSDHSMTFRSSNKRLYKDNKLFLSFPSKIIRFLIWDNHIIILLQNNRDDDEQNVFCYDLAGTVQWQIPKPVKLHAENYFTNIYLQGSKLFAYSKSGIEYHLDSDTGSFINSELIK